MPSRRFLRRGVALTAVFLAALAARSVLFTYAAPRVLGEVVTVTEVTSGLEYTARVDTGAAVSSVHVGPQDVVIEDESPEPAENVAKKIRLRLDNGAGDKGWIETRIEDYAEVRSANGAEHRYRVILPIQCGDVLKQAVVNLNDRSRMTYRFLLGRDFLEGEFLVDVSLSGTHPAQGG